MDRYQYLLLLGACLLITLPLEFVLNARVYRRARLLLAPIGVTVLVFGVWDLWGIRRGTWWYNERFISGLHLPFGMPIEELLFFIVIPLCGLLSYQGVGAVLRWSRTGVLPWRQDEEQVDA